MSAAELNDKNRRNRRRARSQQEAQVIYHRSINLVFQNNVKVQIAGKCETNVDCMAEVGHFWVILSTFSEFQQ